MNINIVCSVDFSHSLGDVKSMVRTSMQPRRCRALVRLRTLYLFCRDKDPLLVLSRLKTIFERYITCLCSHTLVHPEGQLPFVHLQRMTTCNVPSELIMGHHCIWHCVSKDCERVPHGSIYRHAWYKPLRPSSSWTELECDRSPNIMKDTECTCRVWSKAGRVNGALVGCRRAGAYELASQASLRRP